MTETGTPEGKIFEVATLKTCGGKLQRVIRLRELEVPAVAVDIDARLIKGRGPPLGYFLLPSSAASFRDARPLSKSPPTILSMFMNRQKALPMKLFVPVMVQVTPV